MKKTILQTLGIATVALIGQAFCDSPVDAQPATKGYEQGYGVDENQLLGGYNAPGRIAVDGSWSAFISASFIYWLPKEKGLESCVTRDNTVPMGARVANMNHEFKPGFKVGLGFNCDHDNWVAAIGYTRFHSNHSNKHASVSSTTHNLAPLWLKYDNTVGNTVGFIKASGKWRLNMDILDLEMSRPFYLGRHLTFTPVAGLRGGWINQRYKPKYHHEYYGWVNSFHKQNSWLVGPRAGINSRWLLGAGFRFSGDIAAALLYQRFKNHMIEADLTAPTTAYMSSNETKGLVTPHLDINLGLGWGT
ncbi:MAG: Lpg1974 family pore-forming outer membrane protein, partial [Chlamydiota bacterium]